MDRVQRLLTVLCEELERQVKPNLRGIKGVLVHGYLPQVWVFETEIGACSIFIDTEGNARVFPGAEKDPDVTILWRHEPLVKVLEFGSRDSLEPGDYADVLVHTDKGRAAFNYLRKEIGL